MIIDFHSYVGRSLLGEALSATDILARMEQYGIAATVLCPMKSMDASFLEPNAQVAALQAAHPGRFYGFARVNPHLGPLALTALRVGLDDLGLRGLLLHPWEETFAVNDPKVFPLVELAGERGLPIMIETGYPLLAHPLQVGDLAGRYPDLTFIMTHGGQLDSSGFSMTDAEYVMNAHPNLIMETSGFFADELLESLPVALGAHRVIFGSHQPWLHLGLELKRLERASLSPELKAAVMGGNARRLLGLDAAEGGHHALA